MTIAAPSSAAWFDLLRGSSFDPSDDQQANTALDLVGSADAAMVQGQIVGSGDQSLIYLRARLGNADPSTAVYFGIDLNLDGRIDIFVEANNATPTPFVSFHAADPNSAGTGPSNTGWLSTASNGPGETELSPGNFYFEKNVTAGTDLDANGQTDSWYQFGFRLSDLNAFTALAMNGQQLTLDTPVAIYTFTSTSQTSNGDTGGINDNDPASYNATWLALGIGKVGSLSALLSDTVATPTVDSVSTNDSTPLLHGTWGGDMGGSDSLSILVGNTLYTVENGLSITGSNWTLQLPSALATGTYSVTATTTRINFGSVSDTTTNELTIVAAGDSTAPILIASNPADNATGVQRGSDIVLTFSETVVAAGGTITLSDANGITERFSLSSGLGSLGGTVTVLGSTVTLNPGALLAASTGYHVLVSAGALTDSSGNAYAGIVLATALNFTTGTLAGDPSAPQVTILHTADTAPLLTGSWGGSNGGVDTLTVTVDSVVYTTANGLVIQGNTWSLQLPELGNGTYPVLATVLRDGGTPVSDTTGNELTIGPFTGTPDTPTVTPNDATTADPTISGTWGGGNEGLDQLSVTVDGVTYTTANGLVIDGTSWSLHLPALPNATYEVTASVARVGGDTVADTSADELTITATLATTATIDTVTDDVPGTTGTVADDGRTDDTAPLLTGTLSATLAAGERLAIYANGTLLGVASVVGTGWTYADTSAKTTGDTVIYTTVVMNAQDLSGTTSAPYTVHIVTVDTLADVVTISNDNGASPIVLAEAAVTTDTSPLVDGTLQAALTGDEILEVLRNGQVVGTASVSGLVWSFSDHDLTPGETYAYSVRVASGLDHGIASAAHSIIIFAGTPDAPTVTPVAGPETAPTLTGTWGGDHGGSDTLSVTVDGVTYTLGNGLSIDGTAWSIDLPSLPDGTYDVTATTTRDNGGTATDAAQAEVIVDTTPPDTTATIDKVTDNFGTPTPNVAQDGTTDDLTPTLSGGLSAPLAPGETVVVLRDGVVIGTATPSADGTHWAFTDPSAPNQSTVPYTVAVRDAFANTGDPSAERTVTFLSNQGIFLAVDASGLDRAEGTLPNVNGIPATTPFTFVMLLSEPLLVAADVDWRVIATGDAPVDIEDFVGYGTAMPRGTQHLDAGATEMTVTINVRSDSVWALDQTFRVALSSTDPGLALPAEPILGVIRNDDALSGSGAGDRLTGTGGVDTVFGYGGDDVLRGMAGDDLLYGGTGNDTIEGGAGADLIAGNEGTDAVDYSSASENITIDLRDGSMTLPAALGDDTLSSIESALTGSGADRLIGTAAANLLSTGAGDDVIFAGGGSDTIYGGAGVDLLSYAGTFAALAIDLGQTAQQYTVGSGKIIVTGIEYLIGGSGDDTLTGNATDNRLEGGAGNDILTGASGSDTLLGGSGDDTYILTDANDTVIEDDGPGHDRIRSAVTTTLAQNVEDLELTGTAAISGTGNGLANLMTGNAGANTLASGGGDDTLIGGAGADILQGGDGSDLFIVETAAHLAFGEVIAGGSGTDELRLSATAPASFVLTAGTDLERVVIGTGTATDAVTSGTASINVNAALAASALTLIGNAGANELVGTAFDDSMSGNAGSDTLSGGTGDDTLDGGAGFDIASYAGSGDSLILSLALSGDQSAGSLGTDRLIGIEGLVGGTGSDSLTGDGGANALTGGAGHDTLDGGNGDDSLTGGDGSDTATYAAAGSAVTVNLALSTAQNTLGAGTDTLNSVENLIGSAYADSLAGNTTANRIDGGTGDDTLSGGAGADTLIGGTGNDLFLVAEATELLTADVVAGGADTDELRITAASGTFLLGTGIDVERVVIGTGLGALALSTATTAVNVSAAAMTHGLILAGNAGANLLTGSAFDDNIDGGAGNDTLLGGTGDDRLTGGLGFDMASYATATDGVTVSLAIASAQATNGHGTDILSGFEGLIGGQGHDSLSGDALANLLFGGLGSDTLEGGIGNDTMNGGEGSDAASYAFATAGVSVNLDLTSGQNTGGAGTDTLIQIENLIGSGFGDMLTGSAGANRILGGLGADTLIGGGGADLLFGGDGSDTFILQSSADFGLGEVISGGNGLDELRFASTASGTLILSIDVEVERIVIGTGTAASAVSTGNAALNVNAAAMAGQVTLIGNSGTNALTGTAFDDRIEGGSGADTLIGGAGADSLVGGLGNDTLTGGLGADVFIFNTAPNSTNNRDAITDFVTAEDHISLSKAAFAGFTSASTLSNAEFWAAPNATSAHDATDRLIYNTTTGALLYDIDGLGGKAAVQVAQLSANLNLTADDFLLY